MDQQHRLLFYALAPSGLEQIDHWFDSECAGRYQLKTGVGLAQGSVLHALLTVEAGAIQAHRLREIGLDFVKVGACDDVIAFPATEE